MADPQYQGPERCSGIRVLDPEEDRTQDTPLPRPAEESASPVTRDGVPWSEEVHLKERVGGVRVLHSLDTEASTTLLSTEVQEPPQKTPPLITPCELLAANGHPLRERQELFTRQREVASLPVHVTWSHQISQMLAPVLVLLTGIIALARTSKLTRDMEVSPSNSQVPWTGDQPQGRVWTGGQLHPDDGRTRPKLQGLMSWYLQLIRQYLPYAGADQTNETKGETKVATDLPSKVEATPPKKVKDKPGWAENHSMASPERQQMEDLDDQKKKQVAVQFLRTLLAYRLAA